MLNLGLIKIKNEEIKEQQRKIYKRIFRQLCDKINISAETGKDFCLYQVPEFFFDQISYPFNECINYLNSKIEKLKKDKYIIEVIFYKPNVYFIKWQI